MTVKLSVLPNGLRVVSEERRTVETVSLGVWAGVGTRFETLSQNGIAHCLEHMVFKGTKNRSAKDIAVAIEEVGGYLNAFTTREHTCYYARVLKEDVRMAADLLSEMVLYPLLRDQDLVREKDVIRQEIGQTEDTPDELVFDLLHSACYPNASLGRNILGTYDTVDRLTAKQLEEFRSTYYIPSNLVLSAAGNITHQALVDLAYDLFCPDLSAHATAPGVAPLEDSTFDGRILKLKRDLEQVHIAVALPGVGYSDPDFYTHQVLATLLGGGMSSRLFQEIREDRGLAYSVYSFVANHRETGFFSFYAGCDTGRTNEVLSAFKAELGKIPETLSIGEVSISKSQLKAGLMMALESTTGRMEQLGRQTLLFGAPLETHDIIAHVEAVTPEDITRVASGLIGEKNHALAVVGGGNLDSIMYS